MSIAGYVLAGGKSSRMGQDKALLQLGGQTLIELAVAKLQQVCAEVFILSSRPELTAFAPLVPDLHPGCGPLGGVEAALLHSRYDWNLFLAVDMPFISASFLKDWTREILQDTTARIALFSADGFPQPALTLLHRDVARFAVSAMEQRQYKLYPMLEAAGRQLAEESGEKFEKVFWLKPVQDSSLFGNLNTPEEFEMAQLNWHR